jgi:hypothetical protein
LLTGSGIFPARFESAASCLSHLLIRPPPRNLILAGHDKLLVRFKTLTNVMIRDALKVSRNRKGDSDLEVVAMNYTGEPVRQGFESLEGIEMVPGTVHLVDSEFNILRTTLAISSANTSALFFAQC